MTQGPAGVTLKILCSNGMHGAMAELGPQFESASGHKLDFTFDTGVGFNERIARGEQHRLQHVRQPQCLPRGGADRDRNHDDLQDVETERGGDREPGDPGGSQWPDIDC